MVSAGFCLSVDKIKAMIFSPHGLASGDVASGGGQRVQVLRVGVIFLPYLASSFSVPPVENRLSPVSIYAPLSCLNAS